MQVKEFVDSHLTGRDFRWAWREYKPTVAALTAIADLRQCLEIGGGRAPLFDKDEVSALELQYTSNDISQSELHRAPNWVKTAHFDISGSVHSQYHGKYDLIISRMVMEHVSDAVAAYRNIQSLLRPGGWFLHFHPVLYSPPFVINWLFPERLSRAVLLRAAPNRVDDQIPKFPAVYSYCQIVPKTIEMIRRAGFREVELVPFYGHHYFQRFPGLREIDSALTSCAKAWNITWLASFCYAIGKK